MSRRDAIRAWAATVTVAALLAGALIAYVLIMYTAGSGTARDLVHSYSQYMNQVSQVVHSAESSSK